MKKTFEKELCDEMYDVSAKLLYEGKSYAERRPFEIIATMLYLVHMDLKACRFWLSLVAGVLIGHVLGGLWN